MSCRLSRLMGIQLRAEPETPVHHSVIVFRVLRVALSTGPQILGQRLLLFSSLALRQRVTSVFLFPFLIGLSQVSFSTAKCFSFASY